MTCRGCDGTDLSTVLTMEPMPLAGRFAATEAEALAATRYPLEWRECRRCGLVNVWPDLDTDYSDYSYHASDVPALVRHHEMFAAWLTSRFRPGLHIEIGGNDGVLKVPWPKLNIDPSDAWVGPGVNAPFTYELATTLPAADLVTSSNAFAHFSGIADALRGVRHVLAPQGVFIVEVHDLEALLATRQWDSIYHEHDCEWSARSLQVAGALHGLQLTELYRLPLHGGLLRAVFRAGLPMLRPPKPRPLDFAGLQAAYDTAVAPDLPDGSVAYGAAARATVYLDHTRPNVSAVIDGSPRRFGRFVPGLGLPIRSPDAFGSQPSALITAWTQAADIKAKHPDYRGRWVTAWQ